MRPTGRSSRHCSTSICRRSGSRAEAWAFSPRQSGNHGELAMYTLYARAGWGSVLTEAQLAWYGLPYRLEEVGDLFKDKQAGDKLRTINPLAQLPTLVLPDGQVMT